MELWKVVCTALLSAISLFIIAKVLGHKQMSQLDFFDYITGITIGSIAAELATELESPFKPLTAMVVYGIIAFLLSVLADKMPRIRRFVNGTPTILISNGKLYRRNMKKAKLDLNEFLMLCRQEGYFNPSDIQTAVFEYNGRLTILPISAKRPVTPADMNLTTSPESLCVEVIMDGRVREDNLRQLGLDERWLQTQLKAQGYHSVKEIALAICDNNKTLTLFATA